MKSRKKLVILVCLTILMETLIAQSTYPIHITITGFNGSCNNLDLNGKITKLAIEGFVNAINSGDYEVYQGVNCNAFRNELISTMNDKKNTLGSYGCHMTFYVSQCPGATPNSGSAVGVNILGPDQGSCFYSPNTLEEVLNWDKDDEYKQKTLSYGNKVPGETQYVKTDDDSFDKKREDARNEERNYNDKPIYPYSYDLHREQPESKIRIKTLESNNGWGLDPNATPNLGLGVWNSDDLKTTNIDYAKGADSRPYDENIPVRSVFDSAPTFQTAEDNELNLGKSLMSEIKDAAIDMLKFINPNKKLSDAIDVYDTNKDVITRFMEYVFIESPDMVFSGNDRGKGDRLLGWAEYKYVDLTNRVLDKDSSLGSKWQWFKDRLMGKAQESIEDEVLK